MKSLVSQELLTISGLNANPTSQDLLNEAIIEEMKDLHEKVDGIFGYRQMTLHMNRKFNEPLQSQEDLSFNESCWFTLCHSSEEKTI